MNNNTKLTDKEKIEILNKRINEMEEKFFKIHSLAAALIEYENGDKKASEVSNVSENISETIVSIASDGIDIVASRRMIS